MGEDQILETLVAHQDLFSTTQSIFILPFRLVGYALIHGLAWLVGAFEEAIQTLLGHLDFFSNTLVQEWFGSAQVIAWALLIIGVVLLGYQLLINRNREKSHIPINILLCLLVIVGMPTLSSQMAQLTSAATSVLMGTGDSTLAEELTKTFINDNKYIIEHGFSTEALEAGNEIAADSIFDIDVGELLKPEDIDIPSDQTQYGDILEWHLGTTVTGEKYLVESDMGGAWIVGDSFSECYYRYQIDWFVLILVLAGLLICMVFTAIKVGKIIFQIVYNIFFTIFVAPVDIAGGQRLKKCVEEVIYLYLTLMSIALMYRIYLIGVSWATGTFSGLTLAVVLLGMSWGLVDGPNLVQKLFGIDAGLSSVASGLQSIYYGSRIAKDMGQAVAGLAKKAGSVGAFGAGMIAGAYRSQQNPAFNSQNDRNANSPYTSDQLNQQERGRLGGGDSITPSDGNSPNSSGDSGTGASPGGQNGRQGDAPANAAPAHDSMEPQSAGFQEQKAQQETEQAVYGTGSRSTETPEQAVYGSGGETRQGAGTQASQQARQQEAAQAVYGSSSSAGHAPSGQGAAPSQARSGAAGQRAETRTLGDVVRGSAAYGSRQSTAQDGRFSFIRTAYQIGQNTAIQDVQRGRQNIQRLQQRLDGNHNNGEET